MSKIYNSDTHELIYNSEIAFLLSRYNYYRDCMREKTGEEFEDFVLDAPDYYADDTAFSDDFYVLLEILKKHIDNKY